MTRKRQKTHHHYRSDSHNNNHKHKHNHRQTVIKQYKKENRSSLKHSTAVDRSQNYGKFKQEESETSLYKNTVLNIMQKMTKNDKKPLMEE